MTSLATTVKHFANLFSSCPAQNPAHRPTKHPPRFYLQHRIAFRRNRCSAEEGRIIDNQKTTSRRKWKKVLMAHQRGLRAPEVFDAPHPGPHLSPDLSMMSTTGKETSPRTGQEFQQHRQRGARPALLHLVRNELVARLLRQRLERTQLDHCARLPQEQWLSELRRI